MIHSMTGFGRAEGLVMDREVAVEIKTVNNRFKDVIVRLPKQLAAIEDGVRKVVGNRLNRGRVEVWVQVGSASTEAGALTLDLALARHVHGLLRELKKELDLSAEIAIPDLLNFKDIITVKEEALDVEAFQTGLTPIINEALDKLIAMRQTEGQALAADIQDRLTAMTGYAAEIGARRDLVIEEAKTKLEAKIKALVEDVEIDQVRLAQEVAYIVDRSDITEEIVRLGSHFDQVEGVMNGRGAVGRRLEFLLQEMNREVNTIGSKSSDVTITNRVVDLKTELEKLREQVLNIE